MVKRIKRIKKETPPIIILVDWFTEKNYFEWLRSFIRNETDLNKNLRIEILHEENKDFTHLYKKALDYKDNNEAIFIVFDRENESKRKKSIIQKEIEKWNKDSFISIISNQSFDLWIILHFQEFNKEIANLKEYYKILESNLWYKDYEKDWKNDKEIFKKVKSSLDKAKDNAKKLEEKQKREWTESIIEFNEPYTWVYKIIEFLFKSNFI